MSVHAGARAADGRRTGRQYAHSVRADGDLDGNGPKLIRPVMHLTVT